jgi:molecular chaperone DnaK
MGKVVGIDLGTTNSVVSVMEGGKPVVIANAEGMRTTPSVVAFSKEGERLVGQMARRQAVLNPQNTFYNVKRYIGRKYAELEASSKRVPYTIRRDEVGNVKIRCPRLEKDFAPEEISAMILRKLADEASRYLGQPVTGAVITVPAYFNDAQRQATRNAGRIAGLEVKRILNEPTSAALAYGLDQTYNQTILVFDLGGGTFDVSVLDVGDGVFEVRATSGDTQLGGNDFDIKIVNWLAEQFLEREGIDLRKDRQALQRLTEAAEKAKIELSGVATTEISLPFITATKDGPKHLETRLSRSQFESMCSDLVSGLRGPLKQALADAGLTPNDIDEVVLVGGGSRMPMVQELVRSLIGLEPNQNVNPDEVVAIGAAIQAGIITQEVQDILLLDVSSLSLGLETIGGVMKKVIPRNTTIPVRRSDIFSTSENNQTSVEVHVLQGEREMARDNKSLGRFKLMGIPPAPRGVPQVVVSFDIDANGILQVSAMDKTTGREQSITVQGASNIEESEVQRMIQEAEEYAETDRLQRERVEKRNRAEALTFQAERLLREVALDFGMQFARDRRRRIEGFVRELRDYLEQGDDRGIDITQAELQDELYDLNREAYLYEADDEEGDLLGRIGETLKKTFAFDDDLEPRPNYNNYPASSSWDNWDDDWDYDNRGAQRSSQPPYRQDAGYGGQPPYQGGTQPGYGSPTYSDRRYEDYGYNQQGYGSPGYDDRSYGNQGYGNQDYGSQSYDDQGYGGAGYDDRNYSGQSYGDRSYGSQGYDDQRSAPPDAGYGAADTRDLGYGSQGYNDQSYGGRSSDDQGYSSRSYRDQGYGNQGYPEGSYGDQGYGRSYDNQQAGDQGGAPADYGNQGYGERFPEQSYGDRSYRDQNTRRGYNDQGYGSPANPPEATPPQGSAPASQDNLNDDPWAEPAQAKDRQVPPPNRPDPPPRRGSVPPTDSRRSTSGTGTNWDDEDEWF